MLTGQSGEPLAASGSRRTVECQDSRPAHRYPEKPKSELFNDRNTIRAQSALISAGRRRYGKSPAAAPGAEVA